MRGKRTSYTRAGSKVLAPEAGRRSRDVCLASLDSRRSDARTSRSSFTTTTLADFITLRCSKRLICASTKIYSHARKSSSSEHWMSVTVGVDRQRLRDLRHRSHGNGACPVRSLPTPSCATTAIILCHSFDQEKQKRPHDHID